MHNANRQQVLESCRRAAEAHIVITHGTDTMVETAGVLGAAGLDKTIVLTGAHGAVRIQQLGRSLHLGCAVTAVQILPRGVFIVMNGRVSTGTTCKRNREQGIFARKSESPAP